MSKTADGFPLAIKLDFESDVRLRWQVYEGIREAILSGRLDPGARLPASRILAAELGLSRPTVSEAYRILRDEGYVWSRVGSGTFVASKLPDELLGAARVDGDVGQGEGPTPSPSRRCFTLAGAAEEATLPVVRPRPFRHYGPDVEEFPWGLWAKLTARVYRRVPPEVLATGYPAGYEPLREAVASYVAPMRGVRCVPGQVIIASGGTHAIDLAIRFLLDPDDRAWIEEPAFPNTFATLVAAGARPVPVPVDEGGLNVEAGKASAPHARLAMVTPSHHTPLGVTMKLRRRLELLAWAREANAWIFENDYDSEYRHAGPSLAALQGLDADGRVVYMGSFSPTLFWGLRLAYLIVPERLTEIFSAARHTLDIYTHTIQQVVLADFIAEGHLARHLRRMRLLYARRQETLLRSARNELRGILEVGRHEAGMHAVGWLPEGVSGKAAAESARENGVDVRPLSSCYVGAPPERDGLVLGYGAFSEAQIEAGVRRLGRALREAAR